MVREHGNNRLPWLRPRDLTDKQRGVYNAIAQGPRGRDPNASPLTDDEGRLKGPFNAMLFTPSVGAAFQSVGERLRYSGSLEALHRELAILTIAAHERSQVEWDSHRQPAVAAGLTDGQLAELWTGREPARLDPAAQAVHRAVGELVRTADLTDTSFERVSTLLGLERVVELVFLVGYYRALALSLRALGAHH